MTRRHRVLVVSALPAAIALTAFGIGPSVTAQATLWSAVEVAIALAIALVLGLAAMLVARPRTLPYINQFVSRGVELTAALPAILLCAVVAVVAPLPVPIAVAVVIGVLGGLRCIRVVASSTPSNLSPRGKASPLPAMFRDVRSSLRPVVPAIVEQVVGLEAALAWLGLFDQAWTGGWGERLGHAASHGEPALLAWWTLSAAALSLGLKVLLGPAPEPVAERVPSGQGP